MNSRISHTHIRAYRSFFDGVVSKMFMKPLFIRVSAGNTPRTEFRLYHKKRRINMTYYRWMMRKHRNDVSPAGELARDMKLDHDFPRRSGRAEALEYLLRQGASTKCIRIFDETWQRYERSKVAGSLPERYGKVRKRTWKTRRVGNGRVTW